MPEPLIQTTDKGLYCARGDFHIDPWQPVPRAIVTHAHADHARWGCDSYLTAQPGETVLRARLGPETAIQTIAYGEPLTRNDVRLSLHPAGHILGSAQVRVEHRGEVWVVSGDYKLQPDPTCAAFEAVRCHVFLTESTFALPIYRWRPDGDVFAEVNAWWRANQDKGKASLLLGYALGKAQRLLAGLDASLGPIYTHGAVEKLNHAYRAVGVALPPTTPVRDLPPRTDFRRALILAPPSAHGTAWTRRLGAHSTGFASGWMTIRGTRRRKAVDRGFVLSDHADWAGLQEAIAATGAGRVLVTHGQVAVLVRWLRERGLEADAVATPFEGEMLDAAEDLTDEPEAGAATN